MVRIQPSYNPERLVLGEHIPLHTPLAVTLETSERCNFKCNYCFRSGKKNENWSYAASEDVMEWPVFVRIVEQLAAFPDQIKIISLSGHGEPLCNRRLADMAAFVKQSGVAASVDMHTNASLLTPENVKDIANAGFSRIIVSLQGLDADTYERVCGVRLDFPKFYRTLKLLYENKGPGLLVHLKIADVALRDGNAEENRRRFYELFGPIADSVFVEQVVPLWKDVPVVRDAAGNKFGLAVEAVKYCPLLFYKIVVATNGDIYPCTGLPPPLKLGNIHEQTLREAWNGKTRRTFLQKHLRLTRHGLEGCVDCFVPVNSVTSREDIIDPYQKSILERMETESYE